MMLGPYRLPMVPVRTNFPQAAVFGADGRIWAAAGHDLFAPEDLAGPWRHSRVPLPDQQNFIGLDAVGDGVLWLTKAKIIRRPAASFTAMVLRRSVE